MEKHDKERNEIINNFFLRGEEGGVGNNFMSEMHLKQPGCTYSACWPFDKNKERIQRFKETSDSIYIYQN